MITSIKDTNNELYEVLFAKASEILSGFKSVQTYDKDTQYWYKDSNSKSYKKYDLTNGSEEELTEGQLINNFADALVKYGKLYIKTREEPIAGFSPELGITSLEEYYNWLPELKADEEGKPTVFTKLPLDEPYFEIKANTRAITIPDEFKKNGVAVQGDDLAEVVYFMIDRYFDAVDLNNTEIYIEWETPKSKATGTVTKSVSEPYLKVIDDENYYGKLIFGWALSEAITKDSGTLKFAVRFIQRDNQNKIVYSFNTLTSQVTIHPNLGTDMATAIENADNCNARLLERIQESEVVGGAKAKVPYFLLDLVVLEDGYDIEDNHTDGSYALYAVATADDTGAVSYVWRRGELNPDNSEEGTWVDITEGDSLEMIPLTEEELIAFDYKLPVSRVYHIGTSADDTTELDRGLYDLKASFTDKKQPIPTIYERRACLEVTKYGLYKAEARNRIFNSLTKADSETVIFKRPDPVKMVDNQIPNKHIIGTDSAILTPQVVEAVGDLSYQWYRADEDAEKIYKYRVVDVPTGTKISYGNDHIRMMVPADTDFKKQTVGIGGNPNKFYVTLVNYIPDGAVYMRNGFKGVLSDEYEVIAEKSVGTDEYGYFRKVWFDIASFNPDTNTWTYNGKNSTVSEYAGRVYVAAYYDANKEMIRSDVLRIDLSNESCHVELKNYEAVEDIVDGIDLAKQNSYIVTEPGFYKMEVTRIRNRAETKGESIEYRVTNAPIPPVPTEDMWIGLKTISLDDLVNDKNTSLVFTWDAVSEADGFEVEWYLARKLNDDDEEDDLMIARQVFNTGDITSASFNPADPMWINKFEEAEENIEGYYYAIVRTKLNGEYSGYSTKPELGTMFSVID